MPYCTTSSHKINFPFPCPSDFFRIVPSSHLEKKQKIFAKSVSPCNLLAFSSKREHQKIKSERSAAWFSAFDWGSKGREFESLRSDHLKAVIQASYGFLFAVFLPSIFPPISTRLGINLMVENRQSTSKVHEKHYERIAESSPHRLQIHLRA